MAQGDARTACFLLVIAIDVVGELLPTILQKFVNADLTGRISIPRIIWRADGDPPAICAEGDAEATALRRIRGNG